MIAICAGILIASLFSSLIFSVLSRIRDPFFFFHYYNNPQEPAAAVRLQYLLRVLSEFSTHFNTLKTPHTNA
jgi:hypothetical protein